MRAYSSVCLVRELAYPIRRGYFAEMLFPTWLVIRLIFFVQTSNVSTKQFMVPQTKILERVPD